MVQATAGIIVTLSMWAVYGGSKALLGWAGVDLLDQTAMAFLAAIAGLAVAGAYAWDQRQSAIRQ